MSEYYTCNGCRRVLRFDDDPPKVGAGGYTCPECSKGAEAIAAEIRWRLDQCGVDGEITFDYHTNKLTLAQLTEKYGFNESEVLRKVGSCVGYIEGQERKQMSYDEWTKHRAK